MNKDVRIGTDYPHHPKIRKLRNVLGDGGVVSHIYLLCFTARICPSGELKDMDMEDIAIAAQWKGNVGEFVNTLVKLKLLDKRGNHFVIHNWLRWNLFAASAPKRSEIARANIKKRWDKKNEIIQTHNTNGITDSNTPTPSPSPKGEGGRVGGKDFALEEQSFPPPPQKPETTKDEVLELAKDLSYKHGYLEAVKDVDLFLESGIGLDVLYQVLATIGMYYDPNGHRSLRWCLFDRMTERTGEKFSLN